MKYPAPLNSGSTIAITAFSAGVPEALHPRLDIAIAYLKRLGFMVKLGRCLKQNHNYVSASVDERVAELMAVLLNDSNDAIMAPWGGAIGMDLLDKLDWQQLAQAKPKWIIGFSDISTLLTAVTNKLGWATAHGTNLMQLCAAQHDPLTSQLFAYLSTEKGDAFTQLAATHKESAPLDFVSSPQAGFTLGEVSQWRALDETAQPIQFEGRLLGGCLDIHMLLAGSEFFDLERFAAIYPNEKVILYLENGELTPAAYFRALQSVKLRGWLRYLSGILIGRNPVPQATDSDWTHLDALHHAFSDSDIPVLYDVDIGHVAPNLTLINGAIAHVKHDLTQSSITQRLA
ncbi:S66 family peptidase (plasmid) [Pseudoalteromonas sp. T1lg65]|uniref:S66 family peptidase n=1 Tax=Pseudoalteromonas sp. T1lg65 TaxID=2077101 RepID=UPI003F7A2930